MTELRWLPEWVERGRAEGWVLVAEEALPVPLRPYVGNGYLSYIVPPEGNDCLEIGETYLAGVYNGACDLPPHRAQLPSFTGIVLTHGGRTFSRELMAAGRYCMALDVREPRVHVFAEWPVEGGTIRIHNQVTVSREFQFELAVLSEVTADLDTELTVTLPLSWAHCRDFSLLLVRPDGSGAELLLETTQAETEELGKVRVTVVTDTNLQGIWSGDSGLTPFSKGGKGGSERLDYTAVVSLRRGETVQIGRTAVVRCSLDKAHADRSPQPPLLRGVGAEGPLLRAEETTLPDIEIDGDPELQRVVRAGLYYVLASVHKEWPFSIPNNSMSTNCYNGHIFWDTETWIFPAVLMLHPEEACAVLQYRVNTLAGARAKAKAHGYGCTPPLAGGVGEGCHGQPAMFAWESAATGYETTPGWCATGLREDHITADIALAFMQFWWATGEREWLREEAWPLLEATATYWAERVTYNAEEDRYEIHHVIPPDEGVLDCHNSAYTNNAARFNLRAAAEVAADLGLPADPRWTVIADKLFIPFDAAQGIHLEHDRYQGEEIKQADVVLLAFPWQMPMDAQVKRNDLDYYAARVDAGGPCMTHSMHSIIALELGEQQRAEEFFDLAWRRNVHEPMLVWWEHAQGGSYNFLTGIGGLLQAILFGFAGMRITADGLTISPCLHSRWKRLAIRGIHWCGSVFDLVVEESKASIHVRQGTLKVSDEEGNLLVEQDGIVSWDKGSCVYVSDRCFERAARHELV